MPLGNRNAESTLCAAHLYATLGNRYPGIPAAKVAGHVWGDHSARTFVVSWFLGRAAELAAEAEVAFDRDAELATLEELIWQRNKGDRSLAKRGSTISSVSAGRAFDAAYDRLTALVASWS